MGHRIFHATGPGDLIRAHRHWAAGSHDPTEVSITFSSQFQDFCVDTGSQAYIVSYAGEREFYSTGAFTLEHRPKRALKHSGLLYHLSEMAYGLGLLATAIRFRANLAVLDSGSANYLSYALFRLCGIRTIVVLHNTLWPAGYRSTRMSRRLRSRMDGLFFRRFATAVIGVSPECLRQVQQVSKGRVWGLHQIRAQFRREFFEAIPAPPRHDESIFRIMFVGRIHREKGVFDILEIANEVERRAPGRCRWEICGTGPDFDALKAKRDELKLHNVVSIHGWTTLTDLQQVYARSHACIVPTRSGFIEGLAMTAAEAILAGRPLITNSVVPALEILRPACVEAKTDDVASYVEGVLRLASDPDLYRTLCEACPGLQPQFYDRTNGLQAILSRVVCEMECEFQRGAIVESW